MGMLRQSKELYGYSTFTAKVREYEKETGSLNAALKKAIEYCCQHDIIKEFLETHSQEVMSMLMTEFNLEDAIAVQREEAREEVHTEIVLNAFAKGLPIEVISDITGLDEETIKSLVSAKST